MSHAKAIYYFTSIIRAEDRDKEKKKTKKKEKEKENIHQGKKPKTEDLNRPFFAYLQLTFKGQPKQNSLFQTTLNHIAEKNLHASYRTYGIRSGNLGQEGEFHTAEPFNAGSCLISIQTSITF